MNEKDYYFDKDNYLHARTTKGVKEFVKLIKEEGYDDPEVGHEDEDDLHHAILMEAAKGNPDVAQMAKEALKTDELTFSRWYA